MLRYLCPLLLISLVIGACTNNEAPIKHQTAVPQGSTMDSISAEVMQARNLQEAGKLEQALAIANSLIERYPGQLDALSIKAEILKEQGRTAEALAIFEQAYAMQPRDKQTAYDLAYEYAEAKSAKALALTDTLIKYDKTETVARAWYVKATYFLNIGNEEEAMRYYDSSMIADHNFLDTYLDKGQLQFKQKKFAAAEKTFALGQKFSPSSGVFYFWVGRSQEALGKKADAKANYQRAYALDNSLTEAKQAAEAIRL
jgi:tetratricopeptide (TPR) repeat protein